MIAFAQGDLTGFSSDHVRWKPGHLPVEGGVGDGHFWRAGRYSSHCELEVDEVGAGVGLVERSLEGCGLRRPAVDSVEEDNAGVERRVRAIAGANSSVLLVTSVQSSLTTSFSSSASVVP